MTLLIEILKESDAESLYKFEVENRIFFEKMVPTRGDDYYQLEVFKRRHQTLLDEQIEGSSLFYLIKDEKERILGRINLVDIDQEDKTAYLGYRVGEHHIGKGVAKRAVTLLLEMTDGIDLKEIKAKTTSNNIPSQKVLEQTGFRWEGTTGEEFEMNGQMVKFVHYRWKS